MFDVARFRRLAAAQWAERRREWAWFLGVVVALHLVTILIMVSGENGYRSLSLSGQAGLYWAGLMLTAPLFAARYFLPLSRRDAALTILMRPASNLEKFLLALLVATVLYPLVYSAAFYICDLPAALIAKARAVEAWKHLSMAQRTNQPNWGPGHYGLLAPQWSLELVVNVFTVAMLWVVMGWTMFGTLYFRSSPMVKTFVAGFVLFLGLMLIFQWTGGSPDRLFAFWRPRVEMATWQRILAGVAWIVMPALSWYACYLALREREAT